MQLKLKRFDPASIADDKICVVIAKRGSGKSFLLRDVLSHHRSIPLGTVISPTEQANQFFGDFCPSVCIHDEYTPELMANVIKRQEMVMRRINKEKRRFGRSAIDGRAFVVLDDCLANKAWVSDKSVRSMFLNGRHLKLFCCITLQFVLGIPPELRSNVDYTFLLRDTNVGNQKRIYDSFAGCFSNFAMFRSVFDSVTQDYGALVLDHTSRSSKLEDQVFWYKAEKPDPFRIGSRQLWQMSEQADAERERLEDEEDDAFEAAAAAAQGPFTASSSLVPQSRDSGPLQVRCITQR
jgi:hypothetical protein